MIKLISIKQKNASRPSRCYRRGSGSIPTLSRKPSDKMIPTEASTDNSTMAVTATQDPAASHDDEIHETTRVLKDGLLNSVNSLLQDLRTRNLPDKAFSVQELGNILELCYNILFPDPKPMTYSQRVLALFHLKGQLHLTDAEYLTETQRLSLSLPSTLPNSVQQMHTPAMPPPASSPAMSPQAFSLEMPTTLNGLPRMVGSGLPPSNTQPPGPRAAPATTRPPKAVDNNLPKKIRRCWYATGLTCKTETELQDAWKHEKIFSEFPFRSEGGGKGSQKKKICSVCAGCSYKARAIFDERKGHWIMQKSRTFAFAHHNH
jgi:hypothetical protein